MSGLFNRPISITRTQAPVKFLDGTTEPHAICAEVRYEGSDFGLLIVNLVGRTRAIRMGHLEINLSPCNDQKRIARPDDESTWSEPKDGVIFLVAEGMGQLRGDFREAPHDVPVLKIGPDGRLV